MRSAKLFLFGMYLHLCLSVAVPLGILYFSADGWNAAGIGLLFGYLAMIIAVHIVGWIAVGMAAEAYHQNQWEKLRSSWRLLKLNSMECLLCQETD
ncbi:MAG: hypothetical protein Q4C91_00770 [Eubacteriales bacterium]|nr:hypothetical protein [Eubacteriales bacterium]